MHSEGYYSCSCLSVCVLSHISPLERLFVLKILSHTQRATEVKMFVGFSLKLLCLKVMASFAYPWHPTRVLQRHSAHHSLLRVLKRLNNRLNTIWNTTGCKAASSLVSVFPLKSSIYFPLNVIIVRFNSAYAFKTDSLSRVRWGFCTLVHSLILWLMSYASSLRRWRAWQMCGKHFYTCLTSQIDQFLYTSYFSLIHLDIIRISNWEWKWTISLYIWSSMGIDQAIPI